MQAVRVNGNVNQSECIALLASSYNARPCKTQNNDYNQLFEAAQTVDKELAAESTRCSSPSKRFMHS